MHAGDDLQVLASLSDPRLSNTRLLYHRIKNIPKKNIRCFGSPSLPENPSSTFRHTSSALLKGGEYPRRVGQPRKQILKKKNHDLNYLWTDSDSITPFSMRVFCIAPEVCTLNNICQYLCWCWFLRLFVIFFHFNVVACYFMMSHTDVYCVVNLLLNKLEEQDHK